MGSLAAASRTPSRALTHMATLYAASACVQASPMPLDEAMTVAVRPAIPKSINVLLIGRVNGGAGRLRSELLA